MDETPEVREQGREDEDPPETLSLSERVAATKGGNPGRMKKI